MAEKDSLIKGKVARILNSREIVINVGKKGGVKIGMKFDILDPKGEDIRDPDTHEILGSLPRPKVQVKVTDVQENLSVASTYRKKEINVGGQGKGILSGLGNLNIFAKELMPPEWITVYETLKTEEKTWEDLNEKDSYVKTGDPVIQVLIDEE